MTEKQAQAALERWNGNRLEPERLKGDLRRLERLMDEKETPGLSNAQRRGLQRQAQRQAQRLESALYALMAQQRQWAERVQALPPLQASILTMRYGEGLPWRKIAERTGYSEKHLFKLRRAALAALSREERH